MFNLVVGAALVFLFLSGKTDVKSAKEASDTVFEEMTTKAEDVISKASASLAQQKTTASPIEVAGETQEEIVSEAPVKLASAQAEVARPTPVLSPEVAKRREEILNSSNTIQAQDRGLQIAVHEDRQEALRDLAEEMELLSAQMASQ